MNLLPVDRRALEDRSNKIGGCRSKKQRSSIGAKPLDRKVQSHSTVRRERGSISIWKDGMAYSNRDETLHFADRMVGKGGIRLCLNAWAQPPVPIEDRLVEGRRLHLTSSCSNFHLLPLTSL